MEFSRKTVVITGGAQGIGKCIAECFRRDGAIVHAIDKQAGPWFTGDLADKATLERFAADVIAKSGKVGVLVNNAMPLFKGIDECTYEEFAYAQAVGVVAPFYLAKLFKEHFAGRVGNPMDIANMVLYLASDKAGFITGENICIDMHLRRSRQVPRRAKRGALQSKVARGCAACRTT